jgi:hypothetical protein
MIDNKEVETINKGMVIAKIIWAAMLITLVIYLFVGLYLKDYFQVAVEPDVFRVLRNVLYAVAVVTLIATKYIRKKVFNAKGMGQYQGSTTESPAFSKYLVAMIVSLALSETLGIYGLVLFILGKNPVDLYLLLFISAAAMFYYRPQKEKIIELVKKLKEPQIAV